MQPGRCLASPAVTAGFSRSVGHATHFLERLDRVPRSLTDFALGLYRDPERVRWIVEYAHLPANEQRVALALDARHDGPHVVVTRDGNFVTALGAGMTPKNLTILSRAQVDAFSSRVKDTRKRLAMARTLAPPGRPAEDVMRLLAKRAWGLSREQLSAIAAWVPLLATQFYVDAHEHLVEMTQVMSAYLARRDARYRHSARTGRALDLLWNDLHAIGARLGLATMGDLAWTRDMAAKWKGATGPTYVATMFRIHSVAMRGAWAAARMGRVFIPVYRRILSSPGDVMVRFDAALAMTAIGVRHAHHREEARRVVASMEATSEPEHLDWTRSIVAASDLALQDPDEATASVAAFGAERLVRQADSFEEGSALRFARPEDVPRELALLAAANHMSDALAPFSVHSLAWVAKRESVEELYFPNEMARALGNNWSFEVLDAIAERFRPARREPVTRKGPRLGRNARCPCSSGTKYKRCCLR